MTREEWLATLTVGSLVDVYIGPNKVTAEVITRENDKWVTVGKWGLAKNFSRKDGVITGHRPMKHLFRIEPVEAAK
jgi:hypothetical protein